MPYSLLGTLLDTTGEKLKHNVELQDNWRKQKSQFLIDAIHAVDENGKPKMAPEQLETAYNELEKLNNQPGAKDVIKKFRDITTKLHSFGKPNPAMLQRAGQQTSQALSGQGGGNLVAPPATTDTTDTTPQAIAPPDDGGVQSEPMPFTPPPPPRSDIAQAAPPAAPATGSMPTPPPQRTSSMGMGATVALGSPVSSKIAETSATQGAILRRTTEANKQEMQDRADMADKIGLKKGTPAYAQFVTGHGQVLPTSLMKPTKIGQYTGPDKKVHIMEQSYNPDTGSWDVSEKDSEGNVRDLASHISNAGLSVTSALDSQQKTGQKFLSISGDEIDLSKLRPNEELVPYVGDPTMLGRYAVKDQDTGRLIADGMVKTFPKLNPELATNVGVAKTGTEATTNVNSDTGASTTVTKPIIPAGGGAAPAKPATTPAPPATTSSNGATSRYDSAKNPTGIDKHLEAMAVDWATTGVKPAENKLAVQVQNYMTDHDLARPSLPIPPGLRVKVGESIVARNSAIDIIENIKKDASVFNSMLSTGKIALATEPGTGALMLSRLTTLNPQEKRVATNWQALSEHINLLRGPLGATGFRGAEAWEALQSQRGRLLADPEITLGVLDRTEGNLKALNSADKFILPSAGDQDIIRARDPQGNIHKAKKGTPLPKGWTPIQ